jgi:hypothetical protein
MKFKIQAISIVDYFIWPPKMEISLETFKVINNQHKTNIRDIDIFTRYHELKRNK